MKLFILIAIFAMLSSCSKNDKNNQEKSDNDSNIVLFESLSIKTSLINGVNTIPATNLDFATLQPNQSVSQELIITNSDILPLSFGANDIIANDIAPFTFTETCSNRSFSRNRTCKLIFSLINNPSSTETVLTKSLTIKGSIIQLTAILAPELPSANLPIANLIVSPQLLDFGLIKAGESKELSIIVNNRTTATQVIQAPLLSNPKITLTSNTCSSLLRNRSCTMKFRYNASDDELINQQIFTSIANNDIKYSVIVQSPTAQEPQVLAINPALNSSSLSLNEPETVTNTLIFNNIGTIELPSPIQLIAQPSVGIIINSVSCSGGLSRNRSCSVSYSLDSVLLPSGLSQIELKLQSSILASNSHTINVNVTKQTLPCSLQDVQSNGWNVANQASISGTKIGNNISQCIVSSCNSNFNINSQTKACEPKLCNELSSNEILLLGFDISNGTLNGVYPNCNLSCDLNFELDSNIKSCLAVRYEPIYSSFNSCSADQACDGIGSQSAMIVSCQKYVNNIPVIGGQASDCLAFDQSITLSCSSPSGTLIQDILGGTLNYNCGIGQTTQDINPTVICNSGFSVNLLTNSCIEDIVIPSSRLGVSFGGFYDGLNPTIPFTQAVDFQSDGKMIVGGYFGTYDDVVANGIVRLNTDGSYDTTFNTGSGFNEIVNDVKVDSNGKILVGGNFTTYNNINVASKIIRLNTDGSVDNTFSVGTGFTPSATSSVNVIRIQTDGKILVGGTFTGYKGTSVNGIVRLLDNGNIDPTFITGTGANGTVSDIAISSNAIFLVGSFSLYNSVASNRIVKLNMTGGRDSNFNVGTGFNSTTAAVSIDSLGRVLVGGTFSTYKGSSANHFVRILSNGDLDTSFSSGSGLLRFGTTTAASINDIKIINNDEIIAGGTFDSYKGQSVFHIFKVDGSGNLVTSSFNAAIGPFGETINSIYLKPDGKMILMGRFSFYRNKIRQNIVQINSDGSIDDQIFNYHTRGLENLPLVVKKQSDGKVLVGGRFSNYNGVESNKLIRINPTSQVDSSLNLGTGFNGEVRDIGIGLNGSLFVGGTFSIFNQLEKNRFIKLNANGSEDSNFNIGTGFNGDVNSIAVQSNGKILVGGNFTQYNGQSINRLIRLNIDGSVDIDFNIGTGFNFQILSIKVQNDGKILVGGDFTSYNGQSSLRIIRLNTDGTRDLDFIIGNGFNGQVTSIDLQNDGKILVGGNFTQYGLTSRNRIVRLESNGNIDSNFNIGTGFNSTVYSIKVDSFNKILVGGDFGSYNQVAVPGFTRLESNGTRDTSLSIYLTTILGVRSIESESNGNFIIVGNFAPFFKYQNLRFSRIMRVNLDGSIENIE